MSDKKTQMNAHDIDLPQTIIDSFARSLVPQIREYYESEQGKREFEEWLKKQEQENSNR